MTRAYERATKAGEARLANEPRAARKARFVIELTNGCNSDANLRGRGVGSRYPRLEDMDE
ncbi:MAG: hypothetical protein ACREQ5_08330 [Candidatus Dormibacteria bacterium]